MGEHHPSSTMSFFRRITGIVATCTATECAKTPAVEAVRLSQIPQPSQIPQLSELSQLPRPCTRCRQARVPKSSVEAAATAQARSTAAPRTGPAMSPRRAPTRPWASAP